MFSQIVHISLISFKDIEHKWHNMKKIVNWEIIGCVNITPLPSMLHCVYLPVKPAAYIPVYRAERQSLDMPVHALSILLPPCRIPHIVFTSLLDCYSPLTRDVGQTPSECRYSVSDAVPPFRRRLANSENLDILVPFKAPCVTITACNMGGGPRVVVSTAAFHARVRGSVPGLGGLKETKMFLPHPRVKVSIVGSLRDREVACSASDRQGSNFESCVWRTVSSQSSHHPQEILLAQFSLYVHKGGLKPDSFHFITACNIPRLTETV